MHKKNMLILDSERDMADLLSRVAEATGNFKCYTATRDFEIEMLYRDIPMDMAIVSLDCAQQHDFRLLRQIKRFFPQVTIMLTAEENQRHLLRDIDNNLVQRVYSKPIQVQVFRTWIQDFYHERYAVTPSETAYPPEQDGKTETVSSERQKCHL